MRGLGLLFVLWLTSLEARAQEAPIEPPRLVQGNEAPYPPEAMQAGVEGDVALILTIDEAGEVTEVETTSAPLGHGLEEAAVAAALAFRFEPARSGGAPIAVRVPFVYRFRLPPPAALPARAHGRVTDAETGQAVVGAVVELGELATETDREGRFAFEGLAAGAGALVVSSPLHRPATRAIALAEGADAVADVALEPLPQEAEIVVRAPRPASGLTRRTLEAELLRTVPGSFGDPLRAVQNLPGIARAPNVRGTLVVRGSSPRDTSIFVDGLKIPLVYHFFNGPSVLPPEILERIDFYPGNYSVRYGRALAGVIDVGTRRADAERWRGSVDVDLFDAGGFVEGPLGNGWGLAVAGRRSYVDGVIAAADTFVEERLSTVSPAYYDYQARVTRRLSGRHRLSLFVFGSEDSIRVLNDRGNRDDEEGEQGASVAFHRLKLDWDARTDGVEWTLSPTVGLDLRAVDRGETKVDETVLTYGGRFDLKLEAAASLTLRTGVDVQGRSVFLGATQRRRVEDYRPFPGGGGAVRETQRVEREYENVAAATFLEADWRFGDLTLVPGARLDTYRWHGRFRWRADPRLNARYALSPTFALKAGAGLTNQPPPEQRLDPEFGNPELHPEWAEQYGAGFEWRLAPPILLDVGGFWLHRHDLADRVNDVEVNGGDDLESIEIVRTRFANRGEGRSYGLEVLLKHDLAERFYGWVAYTLSRADRRRSSDEAWVAAGVDQAHILTTVASYQLGAGWEVGARFRLVSGNRRTPIVGSLFEGDDADYEAVRGARNSVRQGWFDQLDLRVEKTWAFPAWRFSAYLDLQNVYNADNTELTTYDYRYRESAGVPSTPIFPSFGVQGRY